MEAPPKPVTDTLQIHGVSLRFVRLSSICSVLFILIPPYFLLLLHFNREDASNLLVPIWLFPVWLPHLLVWWRLRQTSDPRRVKKALALAVVWSSLVLIVCLLFLTLASEEGWQFRLGLAIFGLLQITLLSNAVKAYYSMERQNGEWKLLALPLGYAFLVLIAAIMIPHLMRSTVAIDEASGVGSLRAINLAQAEHAKLHPDKGFTSSLAELASPPGNNFIDGVLASGTKQGYVFTFTAIAAASDSPGRITHYTVTARPQRYKKTGFRNFFMDETGIIRYAADNRPATVQDPPL